MDNFISSVLQKIQGGNKDFQNLVFILPNKRAGVFLKKELSKIIDSPLLSPEITDIESFISNISQLKHLSNVDLLFHFYKVYQKNTPSEQQESIDAFLAWAPTLLQDFNEIDRHIIDPDGVFDYLEAISDLNHWSLNLPKTDIIESHIRFWHLLKRYYHEFKSYLLANNTAYQGLSYRMAVDGIEAYMSNNSHKQHVFLGFNALNKAESYLIQELLQNDMADIYWDIDEVFFKDPIHSAGLFTRDYKSTWSYYRTHEFQWIGNDYSQAKQIEVIGVPKHVGQAKCVGQLLNDLVVTNNSYSDVAVVLGDESLLLPVLSSIPEKITTLNVTMGMPLKDCPLASLFEYIFGLHKKNESSYYYKDVLKILSHPSLKPLENTEALMAQIQKENKIYISKDWLIKNNGSADSIVTSLFEPWNSNAGIALEKCRSLIFQMKALIEQQLVSNSLELEYLFRFHSLFNKLSDYQNTFKHFSSIQALHKVYNELLSSESLDFKGEPLMGLQIMGMLESRALDFETVIITSVNEGLLPAGKSQNSFIPFDVKLNHKLPTYKEKDAIYTYHFFRLIQRAKRVFIIYNTEVDVLTGGEKSRFINQLEVEGIHDIKHSILTPKLSFETVALKEIEKTESVLSELQNLANKGFSPSSLANYLRNPIDFYTDKILGIDRFEEVEETIAANTLGTILHETLEDFYKPFIGKILSVTDIKTLLPKIPETISIKFERHYGKGNFSSGKNLIAFKVAQRYIYNFLTSEIADLKAGNSIKILKLEHKTKVAVGIPSLEFPVHLKGTVDRIDLYNGGYRIIDYKSGRVETSELNIVDWESLATDYKKSKALQLLCYAYMLSKSVDLPMPINAGVISFKNLNSGFLAFGTKASAHARSVNNAITEETLELFEEQLVALITEICNPELMFQEKEV